MTCEGVMAEYTILGLEIFAKNILEKRLVLLLMIICHWLFPNLKTFSIVSPGRGAHLPRAAVFHLKFINIKKDKQRNAYIRTTMKLTYN